MAQIVWQAHMPLSGSSPGYLLRVTLAMLGLWFCAAPAAAGLSSSVRTVQPIDYVATEVRSERDYDLQAYWKDQIGLLEWNSPRGVTIRNSRVYGPKDRELLITMLDGRAVCGIRECPVRIYAGSGELVLETSACDQPSLHAISLDSGVFIACGVEHRIEQSRFGYDPEASAASTKRFWHNGSIVEATFGADGSISIRYVEPRDGLPSYMRGLVLFEGRIDRGNLTGMAYTFKAGCAPAPYSVSGVFSSSNIALAGASPARDPYSCAVTEYTFRSANARLSFVDLTKANR